MKLVRGAWEGLGVLAARMVFASVVADLKKKKQTNQQNLLAHLNLQNL